jgi:hypothetical protein
MSKYKLSDNSMSISWILIKLIMNYQSNFDKIKAIAEY